jgi:hypothetical protein
MAIDVKTLEQHHNALQVMFNLLLHSMVEKSPSVVESWLGVLEAFLDNEPDVRGKQREVMEQMFLAATTALESRPITHH